MFKWHGCKYKAILQDKLGNVLDFFTRTCCGLVRITLTCSNSNDNPMTFFVEKSEKKHPLNTSDLSGA